MVRACMPKLDLDHQYILRSKGGYIPFKNYNNKYKNSFFPHISRLWNDLPSNIQGQDKLEFKEYINKEIKPFRYKHFSKGNRISNILLTKIRVGRSDLNQHKFTIGLINSPECLCHHREESPLHYFIDCFLYLPERQTLFNLFEHYIPNFNKFTKQKKIDVILPGIDPGNTMFISRNVCSTKLYFANK